MASLLNTESQRAHHIHRHVRENRPELLPNELLRYSMDPLQYSSLGSSIPLIELERRREKSEVTKTTKKRRHRDKTCLDADGVLRRDGSDDGGAVRSERRGRLDVGLDARAGAGVGAGHRQHVRPRHRARRHREPPWLGCRRRRDSR
jgi:hypothetical protein